MKASLKKDILNQVESIYSRNATGAIGYLCRPTSDGLAILDGMFCHNESEINKNEWTYFYNNKTQTIETL